MQSRDWNPLDDAWASGFFDGEGSFNVIHAGKAHLVPRPLVPCFSIGLRADEVAVLRTLADTFGGGLTFKAAVNTSRPVVQWHVAAKSDLSRLRDYLDRFPLRAKKARDYAIWREAVGIYIAHGWRGQGLTQLREELMAGREYVKPDPAVIVDLVRRRRAA